MHDTKGYLTEAIFEIVIFTSLIVAAVLTYLE
jgi:hypothetical protein